MPESTPKTLLELFRIAVARDKADQLNHKVGGAWRPVSTRELAERVRTVAMGLHAIGVKPGSHVGLLSENRVEWTVTDLAALHCGAADVPIYPTQAPKQVAYILNDAGVEVLFLSNQAQYDRVSEALNSCPKLRVIISFDPVLLASGAPSRRVMSFEDFLNWGRAADEAEPTLYETLGAEVAPDTLATLIYTSGTTGDPKGVMLSHGNLTINAVTNLTLAQVRVDEVALSFLPFSHIFERITIYMYLLAGVSVHYAESIETVGQDLLSARPNFMTSVPRLFEKIHARAVEKAEASGPMAARIARWSFEVAKAWAEIVSNGGKPGPILAMKHAIADKLVFSKWREAMGGRLKTLVSGGAPLSRELALIFYGAGLPIYEGYGLTESAPTISVNHQLACRLGSVGRPSPQVQVRIAEDGEILAAGPNIMRGYYNREEETAAALETDADGRVWLHTGDIGYLDEDGFLFITDRKKDLLKTSGGKYIAPQPIENAIKRSRYVNQVVVIGDNRKFPSALIVPQMELVQAFAQANEISAATPADLLRDPRVVKLLESEVEKNTGEFSQYEKIKAVLLLDREMTIESGELTPTLKVKRRVVVDRHKRLIDQLYAEKEAAHTAAN
ncbi:MAG: long-chain fatty acid--CoA ligase [Blastocatellia bacterium]|nr:long-chain fatty acid--CoA ligase [Blastocatellia bacterium]